MKGGTEEEGKRGTEERDKPPDLSMECSAVFYDNLQLLSVTEKKLLMFNYCMNYFHTWQTLQPERFRSVKTT